MLAGIEEILEFWFADALQSVDALVHRNKIWFGADREFDHEVRSRFETTLELADTGACDHWAQEARGLLALILLFDQFPRNIHRGTAQAFAYDDKGERLARAGVNGAMGKALSPVERVFLYMPLQHVEDLVAQDLSVELFAALAANGPGELKPYLQVTHRFAVDHRDIIARFGRFPHRNAVLGRESTDAERAYLDGAGANFGQ